jgi:hypothetical protein
VVSDPLTREPELSAPVDLCDARGRLAPEAVGWSRRPLHRCNLRGRPFAKKRWNYWAFTTPEQLFSATISDIDYVGLVFVYWADWSRGEHLERTLVTHLGRGVPAGGGAMPEHVEESVRFGSKELSVDLLREAGGWRVGVRCDDFGGRRLVADLRASEPPGHETLNVVIPWSRRQFQFTAKHNTLPARGSVRIGEREIAFEESSSFGCLDFGRGIWPRSCVWNWGSASGRCDGHVVGLNLGGQWTRGTGMTENALCMDGRLHKLGEELDWRYDRSDFMRPWSIQAPRSGRVSLAFRPLLERVAATNALVVRSRVHQLFGHYEGHVVSDSGERLRVDGLTGWVEEHVARW